MKLIHLFLVFVVITSFSCKKKVVQQTASQEVIINASNLLGKWFHSHEEDLNGVVTYRPEGYDFPPARGRRGCNFLDKGGYEQYEIAPTDGLQTVKGSWKQEGEKNVIINLYTTRKLIYNLEIIELNKKILRFKISNLDKK